MRAVLINGSPKVKDSASAVLLGKVKELFGSRCEIEELHFKKASVSEEDMAKLKEADVMVFAYPLYVDGIPGHLLSCLMHIEKAGLQNRDALIYGVCNCGFYEGIQAEAALGILKNWSIKAGFVWGGGIGVGGGGCIAMLPKIPTGKGPMASIDKELMQMTDNAVNKASQDNRYANVNMPRFVYKQAAQMGWRQAIKSNGLKAKDLDRRPE